MLKILHKITALVVLLSLIWLTLAHSQAQAATHLQDRFDEMSTSEASATATHLFGFTITDIVTPLGSIKFEFCANDPLPNQPCTPPTGLDTSGAALSNQSGNGGFSIFPGSPNNEVVLTRPASLPTGVPSTYELGNIINPSTADTFYVRLYTYASTDGSGADTQDGGIAAAINSIINVNAEVPPYLKFCAGASIVSYDCTSATDFLVNMGNLSTAQAAVGTSQFVVATNAQSGYSINVSGSTLTSGNDVIPQNLVPNASQTGVSQFGINLRGNGNPVFGTDPQGPGIGAVQPNYNIPDEFMFKNGDALVQSPNSSDNQKFTVSYLANINTNQTPGVYVDTLTYICLANF